MKNINKAMKNLKRSVGAEAGLRFLCVLAAIMAHVPGGAKAFCNAMQRSDDKHEFKLIDVCREISKNGAESEFLREAYLEGGRKEAKAVARLAHRFDSCYSTLALLAMLEENEQLKKEES